jgi:F-type H+-transporting ATPase subunit b
MWKSKNMFWPISILAVFICSYTTSAQAAGLPQLEVGTFPSQLIWLAITFGALFILMSHVSLPRISQVLEERQHKIDGNLKKAETLKDEAEIAAATYAKAQAEAREDAHAIILEARRRITDDMTMKQNELSDELEAEIKAAERRILAAKRTAMEGIEDVSTEVAQDSIEKFSGVSLSNKEVGKVVADILKERQ